MKKIVTFGVFDLFHFGHLRLLKRMSKLGDYLVVAVMEDEFVIRSKHLSATSPHYSTEERVEMVRALRCVDEVITYRSVAEDIKKVDFDIWVKGPDQEHAGFQAAIKWCEEHEKQINVLPRTEGISSTYIKRLVSDVGSKENMKD